MVTRGVMRTGYRARRGALRGFPAVVAGLVAAEDDLAFLLGLLLEQVRAAAIGARLGQRTVIGGELALRVAAAAVERPPPAPLALHDLPLAAVRAGKPDLLGFLLLDVLAVRIVAAGDEGAEAASPPHEVLGALRALLVDGGEHLDLELPAFAADEALGDLAVGIVRAGKEGAEAALLEDHGLAVVGTDLLGHVLVHLGAVALAARHLARVLALRVRGAGEEGAVAPELLHHGRAALVALLVG